MGRRDGREFMELARGAQPALGRLARRFDSWSVTSAARMLEQGYRMVAPDLIEAARGVRRQMEMPKDLAGWCCGPNSAARACVMLGHGAPDIQSFTAACPRSLTVRAIFETWQVGPTPESLRDYLIESGHFAGVGVRAARVDRWGEMLGHINHSMDLQRPMIVLLAWGQMEMHYLCVVGVHPGLGRVGVLNTNGVIYEMSLQELEAEMAVDAPFDWGLKLYNAVDFPW